MKSRIGNRSGFTLIELIMVIVVLGILAAVAVPKYFDMQGQAEVAAEKGVVGGVRAGIQTYFAQNKEFPATLDTVTAPNDCSPTSICFNTILNQGAITDPEWSKDSATTYTGPAGTLYTYDSATGSFL